MATETIKEFLVSLGFATDEPALKKFEQGIGKATKSVIALAAAIEGTAVAVSAGIARWAGSLETLYFASQRTGSSVTALKALELASQNLGANAGEAEAAVESLAATLRTQPGDVGLLSGILGQVGMSVKYLTDGSIDATDALIKLSQAFKSMGPDAYFQAAQFASQLGISEHTLYQLTHGNLVAEYQKALAALGRGGFDQAAEHAHAFMVDLRDFGAQLEVFGVQVADAIQQKLGLSLKDIRKWFEINGPWLAARVADVAKQMIDAAIWIADKVGLVINKLREWDTQTGGLSTKLLALAVLLKVSGAGSIIGGVLSLAAAFLSVAAAIQAIVAGLALLSGYKAGKWIAEKIDAHIQGATGRKDETLGGWLYEAFHRGGDSLGLRLNNPGNLEFRNQAYAIPGGPGGRWADFASPGEGLFALGRQLELYGMRGMNSVQSIVSKWAPPGENNTAAYIRDVMKHTGYSANQALNLQDPAVLSNLMNAVIWHEQGKNPYQAGLVSGKAGEAIDYVRGTASVSQQTTIHVNGAGDPAQVAKRVADQQRKVNADLTRNLLGATR